ncbi:hypothetical protein L1887_62313 [Cichorium endivia]|nr:hypothetical protein L1887_62313 [Cichorium endivia]
MAYGEMQIMNGAMQVYQQQQQNRSMETVSLSRLIEFSIQRTYHELTVLTELLPRKSDMERKIEIVTFVNRTKQLFLRLLALVKWAGSAGKVEKCSTIVSFLDKQSMLFTETRRQSGQNVARNPNASPTAQLSVAHRSRSAHLGHLHPPAVLHKRPHCATRSNQAGRESVHSSSTQSDHPTPAADAHPDGRQTANTLACAERRHSGGRQRDRRRQRSRAFAAGQFSAASGPRETGPKSVRPLYDAFDILHSFCLSLQLERFKKTAEYFFSTVQEQLPFSSKEQNAVIRNRHQKLYFQFLKNVDHYFVVVFTDQTDSNNNVLPDYYLMSVEPAPIDWTKQEKQFAIKRKFDEIDYLEQADREPLQEDSFFIAELVYLYSFCEEKMAYSMLSAALQRHNICHHIRFNSSPDHAQYIDVIQLPTPDAQEDSKLNRLHRNLLSCSINLQGKFNKIWVVAYKFANRELPENLSKSSGTIKSTISMSLDFQNSSPQQISRLIDEMLNDWVQFAKLYDILIEFSKLTNYANYLEVFEFGSFNYKKMVLNYGPNFRRIQPASVYRHPDQGAQCDRECPFHTSPDHLHTNAWSHTQHGRFSGHSRWCLQSVRFDQSVRRANTHSGPEAIPEPVRGQERKLVASLLAQRRGQSAFTCCPELDDGNADRIAVHLSKSATADSAQHKLTDQCKYLIKRGQLQSDAGQSTATTVQLPQMCTAQIRTRRCRTPTCNRLATARPRLPVVSR